MAKFAKLNFESEFVCINVSEIQEIGIKNINTDIHSPDTYVLYIQYKGSQEPTIMKHICKGYLFNILNRIVEVIHEDNVIVDIDATNKEEYYEE